MTSLTIGELRAMPATVDLMTAARALGLGRTKAYELARREQFPCRVIRIGDTYRIPTAGLLDLLGIPPAGTAVPAAQPTGTAVPAAQLVSAAAPAGLPGSRQPRPAR